MSEIIIDKNAKQITFTNNGIGFSQFGVANEILDLIGNQAKEIERLNKKIEQYENPEDMTLMFMWCDEKAKDEIKRLNNIINELEKYLQQEINLYKRDGYDKSEIRAKELWLAGCYDEDREVLDKLQELKGSDKE